MHELAVCQSLLEQVVAIAHTHRARAVSRIVVGIGPLSGVEGPLLEQAFTIARAGTLAAAATLELEPTKVVVHCKACGAEGERSPQRLTCPACGNFRTRLISGDELLLMQVELEDTEERPCVGTAAAR